jgi:hypothetical protein
MRDGETSTPCRDRSRHRTIMYENNDSSKVCDTLWTYLTRPGRVTKCVRCGAKYCRTLKVYL